MEKAVDGMTSQGGQIGLVCDNSIRVSLEFDLSAQGLLDFLTSLGLDRSVVQKAIESYDEPNRFYHNTDHMLDVVSSVSNDQSLSDRERILAIVAAVFHDCVYFAGSKNNEERSCWMFHSSWTDSNSRITPQEYSLIWNAIKATEDHLRKTGHPVSKALVDADIRPLKEANVDELFRMERLISMEHGRFNIDDYLSGRIAFLERYRYVNPNIESLISYLKHRKPVVAYIFIDGDAEFDAHTSIAVNKLHAAYDKAVICLCVIPGKDHSELADRWIEASGGKVIGGRPMEVIAVNPLQMDSRLAGNKILYVDERIPFSRNVVSCLMETYPSALVNLLPVQSITKPEVPQSVSEAIGSIPEIEPQLQHEIPQVIHLAGREFGHPLSIGYYIP
jgi:predicted metal-dependent HD superfamily phosphohydrolase